VHVRSANHAALLAAERKYSHVVLVMESQSRGMRDRVVAALQAYSATAAPPLDLCVLTGGVQARAYAQAFPFMCSDHPFFVNGRLMPSLIDALLPGEDGTSLRLADGSSAVFLCQLTDKRPTKAAPSRRRKAKGSSPSTGPVLGAPVSAQGGVGGV
jgi:hypothetical protein